MQQADVCFGSEADVCSAARSILTSAHNKMDCRTKEAKALCQFSELAHTGSTPRESIFVLIATYCWFGLSLCRYICRARRADEFVNELRNVSSQATIFFLLLHDWSNEPDFDPFGRGAWAKQPPATGIVETV
jgi:hypothetical protein